MVRTSEAFRSRQPREGAGLHAPHWQEKPGVLGSFKSSTRLCPCASLLWGSLREANSDSCWMPRRASQCG